MFLPSKGWQKYFYSPDRGNESLPHRPYLTLQHSPPFLSKLVVTKLLTTCKQMSYNTAIDRTTLITSITYDLGKAWKERIPMKIAVAAANGKASGKIIAEALKRGHEVVAFGRHEQNDTGASTYIKEKISWILQRKTSRVLMPW